MKLIFHIGTHKTGTTSIQNTLDNNIELLKKYKVRYFTLHKELKFLHKAFYPEIYGVKRSRELYDNAKNKFFEIVSSTDFDAYIISGEDMSGFIWDWTERLSFLNEVIECFPEAEIQIVVYFRNPVSSCISIYQELVKGNKFTNSFDSFMTDKSFSIYSGGLDWYLRSKQITNLIQPEKLTVKCFESSGGKGFLLDFLTTIGLSDIKELVQEEKSSNQSVNMKQLAEMITCNESFNGSELKEKKSAILLNTAEGDNIYNLLTAEEKKKLLRYYYESNIKLFNEYVFMPIHEKWKP
jgi:hypothetical protein